MNLESANNNLELKKEDPNELSLKEFIASIKSWSEYLFSRWKIILAISLLGGILGFVYAKFKKTIYTATTTFVLEDGGGSGGGLGQYAGLASMVGVDIGGVGGGLFSGDNIIELYKSRTMLQKTLLTEVLFEGKRQLLAEKYLEGNDSKQKAENIELLKQGNPEKDIKVSLKRDSLLGKIVSDIRTNYLNVSKVDKKLSIIKVEIQSTDEMFAKAFTDQIVATVNSFYVETKTKRSTENIAILQHQKDSVQAVMNGAIFASAATFDATPNLNPTRQSLRAPAQRAQFNAETNKAILSELVKNLELSKISLRKETPLIQVIDLPVLPLEKARMGNIVGFVLGSILFGFLIVGLLSVKMFLNK